MSISAVYQECYTKFQSLISCQANESNESIIVKLTTSSSQEGEVGVENVTRVRWSTLNKFFSRELTQLCSREGKVSRVDWIEAILLYSPVQPSDDILTGPLLWVYSVKKVNSMGLIRLINGARITYCIQD